jgi:peroxiredoxin
MKKNLLLLFCMLAFSASSFAFKTTISGSALNAKEKKIRLIAYGDMISYLDKELASSAIDAQGNFSMEINIEKCHFCFLRIDYQNAEIYIEPKSEYELKVVYTDSISQISYTRPVALKYEILSSTTQLNQNIQQFNQMYNNFVVENFDRLYKNRDKALLQKFVQKTGTEFEDSRNPYFRNYTEYTFVSIEKFSRMKSYRTVAEDFFIKKPVLYNNIAYMDFFNQFFEKYFAATSKGVDLDELIYYINSKPNYYLLLKTASKDELLSLDLRIAELVVLKTLNELYFVQGFNQKGIISILKTASEKMRYSENKVIASNLVKKIRHLRPGTQIPDFELPDLNGKITRLSSFSDTLVYINFWNNSCQQCLQELDSIKQIRETERPGLEFISILTDQSADNLADFVSTKGYDWVFLHFDNNYEMLEEFGLRTLPTNIIVGRNRKIVKNPAWLPGENLNHILGRIDKRKNRR